MKHFGTVKSFDEANGQGSITPENGGEVVRFERRAILWDRKMSFINGQRLSYDLSDNGGETRAVNLEYA